MYPYSEKSDKLYSPLQRAKRESPMNNSWWQELMRFFLQGMTLKQLIHMLIILIVLIIVMPVSVKEWIN
ncbi:superinfection exclusion protein B, partial [Salmonella enterica subsp. enterica serovar Agona]|nr:superinfection exclusion protein B [Salmonella enterica subsp. enterica serovar Agona]